MQINAYKFDEYDSIAAIIHLAAAQNFPNLIKALLTRGEGYDTVNHIGWDFLFFAASNGCTDIIKLVHTMVSADKFTVKDINDRTLYHLAAINDRYTVIETLLSLGINNYTEPDKSGKTPLHFAAEYGYKSTTELLATKINQQTKDKLGMTPLHYAAHGRFSDTLQVLLKSPNLDINACDNQGKSVLYHACEGGSVTCVKMLIEKGADVNKCANDGKGLATVAVITDNFDLLQYLSTVESVDIVMPDKREWTPVHFAAQLGNRRMLEFFLEKKPDSIYKANLQERAPLSIAAAWGRLDSLHFFSKIRDIDYSIPDIDYNTPLHLAIMNGHEEFVEALLQTNEVDINMQNSNGETPLMLAILNWSTQSIKRLVENNCNLNLRDKKGRTALILAAREGQVDIVNYLVAQPSIDTKIVDNDSWGPQHYAAILRTSDVTQALVQTEKFNFDIITRKGKRPIDLAKEYESKQNVQYLNTVLEYNRTQRRSTTRSFGQFSQLRTINHQTFLQQPAQEPKVEEEEEDDYGEEDDDFELQERIAKTPSPRLIGGFTPMTQDSSEEEEEEDPDDNGPSLQRNNINFDEEEDEEDD